MKPCVLAVEPDPRQASLLRRVLRDVARAELLLVDSKDAALAALETRTPDLLLLSALLSPRDESELLDHLRRLEGADHLQTLTIPLLAAPRDQRRTRQPKLLGALRRKTSARGKEGVDSGCDPSVFAAEIKTYLKQACERRGAELEPLLELPSDSLAGTTEIRGGDEAPAAAVDGFAPGLDAELYSPDAEAPIREPDRAGTAQTADERPVDVGTVDEGTPGVIVEPVSDAAAALAPTPGEPVDEALALTPEEPAVEPPVAVEPMTTATSWTEATDSSLRRDDEVSRGPSPHPVPPPETRAALPPPPVFFAPAVDDDAPASPPLVVADADIAAHVDLDAPISPDSAACDAGVEAPLVIVPETAPSLPPSLCFASDVEIEDSAPTDSMSQEEPVVTKLRLQPTSAGDDADLIVEGEHADLIVEGEHADLIVKEGNADVTEGEAGRLADAGEPQTPEDAAWLTQALDTLWDQIRRTRGDEEAAAQHAASSVFDERAAAQETMPVPREPIVDAHLASSPAGRAAVEDPVVVGPADASPLARWTRSEYACEEPPPPRRRHELQELLAGLDVPAAVASVRYAGGCRVGRVRVRRIPRQKGAEGPPIVIVSRRMLNELRSGALRERRPSAAPSPREFRRRPDADRSQQLHRARVLEERP